jgi:shikimate kinase/3-dehydroquinate synthase
VAKIRVRDASSASAGRAERSAPKLVVVGFMAAGKSKLARSAAERLGWPLADADQLLEQRLGEPIEAFFDREGEQAFRDRERELVVELLTAPERTVVALGGGAIESEAVRAALAPHLVVHVEVDVETAWERAHESGRPLARDRAGFVEIYERRAPLYDALARVIVVGGKDADALSTSALALAAPGVPDGVRMLWARAGAGHPVYVGAGALGAAGALWPTRGRCFLVADERALALHGETLLEAVSRGVEMVETIAVPPGERHKTLAEAERVLRALARAGMQRADTLLAFGGGVVGDLAGFCAATYQRGVAVVQIPTTVVAQVDSAYGGKTGVDLPEAKNYVGAFHQPAAVVTDPGVLATLPVEELRAGFAEVLKTALLAGGELWQRVRALGALERAVGEDLPALARIVEDCARTKLAVVAADERDTGARAALNLGHTFAHALESATDYATFRHGEAVALGLLVALRVSERAVGLDAGVRTQVRELLARNELPLGFDGPPTGELLEHMARDKKRRAERRNLVLLRAPGDAAIGSEVHDDVLEEAIDELRLAGGSAQ